MTRARDDSIHVIMRCMEFLKPYLALEILALLATICLAALSLTQPWIQKLLIDNLQEGGSPLILGRIVLLLLGAVTVRILFDFLSKVLFSNIREKACRNLRARVSETLFLIKLKSFNSRSPGEIASYLLQDVEAIGTLYGSIFADLVTSLLKFAGVVIIMVTLDFDLTMLTLGLLLVLAVLFRRLTRPVEKATKNVLEATSEATESLSEFWRSLPETRVLNSFGLVDRMIRSSFEALRRTRFRKSLILSLISTNEITIWVLTCTILLYMGYKVIAGVMTVGSLIAFWGYLDISLGPINIFLTFSSSIRSSLAGARRLFRMIDSSEYEKPREGAGFPSDFESISLRGVSFGYREEERTIDSVSLDVRRGEKIGIIGRSGSGKSTVMSLLLGLYEPDEGAILVDGRPLSEISLSTLRSSIGYIPQDTYIYRATAFDNIHIARPEASGAQVLEAARKARIHDFIMGLPRGYDTLMGEGLRRVSTGQKQRFALARVFLKDPQVLVLDEATSSIDNETAGQILQDLFTSFAGRTFFVISHHRQALSRMDRYLHLERGSIYELSWEEAQNRLAEVITGETA